MPAEENTVRHALAQRACRSADGSLTIQIRIDYVMKSSYIINTDQLRMLKIDKYMIFLNLFILSLVNIPRVGISSSKLRRKNLLIQVL